MIPMLTFLEKGVFLGSDLKWESPPGCVTFYGNCLVIQALSSNTTREVDIHGDIFVHGIVSQFHSSEKNQHTYPTKGHGIVSIIVQISTLISTAECFNIS